MVGFLGDCVFGWSCGVLAVGSLSLSPTATLDDTLMGITHTFVSHKKTPIHGESGGGLHQAPLAVVIAAPQHPG
jgi:hypothetical protein